MRLLGLQEDVTTLEGSSLFRLRYAAGFSARSRVWLVSYNLGSLVLFQTVGLGAVSSFAE